MSLRSDTIIKAERLLLRQIDETDAESIVSLRSNKEVYKYFYYPKQITVEDHNRWFRDCYTLDENRIDWIAVGDNTGSFIGVYGVVKESSDTIEVNYITNPKHYGCGYAAEAVNSIIAWCRNNWNIRRAKAIIHNENLASIHFAQSIGFCLNESSSAPKGFCVMEKKFDD